MVDDSSWAGRPSAPRPRDYGHLLLLGPADPGWFDTPSQMPGALIEPLFITDPFEGSIADSASGQQVIAGGLAQAVEQYFAPPATGKNSEEGDPGTHHTEKGPEACRPLPERAGQRQVRAREISAF